MKDISTKTIVFTDGSSRGNPGKSGYGALLVFGYFDGATSDDKKQMKVVEIAGAYDVSTNNRMEMTALLKSFQMISDRGIMGDIEIHTDSAYVYGGMMGWIYAWEKNGWKTGTKEDVLNQDIWKELLKFAFSFRLGRNVSYVKVAGHAGVPENERVDLLATSFADGEPATLFTGSLYTYESVLGAPFMSKEFAGEVKVKEKKDFVLYLSLVGGVIEEHTSWESCKARVHGKKGVKYKKVTNYDEKKRVINEWSDIQKSR